MKLSTALASSVVTLGLVLAIPAFAQQGHDQHHPAGASGAPGVGMPGPGGMMGPGAMGPGGMPMGPGGVPMGQGGMPMGQGGNMGPGGRMGQPGPMTGPMGQGGMMGPGMMGPGGMGPGGMMGHGMMGQGGMMQMMGGNCPMSGMMMGGGKGDTHAAGRIAFIKADLAITDAQKPAFDAYAVALERNFTAMMTMRQTMMANMDDKTASGRLDAQLAAMEARMNALKAVKPALDGLYAVLTPEQKKKADQILTGMGCMM